MFFFICIGFVCAHAQSITGFTLVNADTDLDLFQIGNGQRINIQELPTANLNIRADVSGITGSASFFLNGSFVRTENVLPYALNGDRNGDYAGVIPELGTSELQVIAYSNSGAGGVALDTASISILFVDEPTEIFVTNVEFVNCPTSPLTVGDEIDLDVLITPANATNQTIAFTASDGTSVDFLSGEFTAQVPGTITVTATSFSDGAVFDQCTIEIIDIQPPIDPYEKVQAEDFSAQSGIQLAGNGSRVGFINHDDFIRFDNVQFGRGPVSGVLAGASNRQGGTVEFRTGTVDGPLLATTAITNTGGWSAFQDFVINVPNAADYENGTLFLGTQTLFLVFKGGGGFLFDVDQFRFNSSDILVTDISFTNCPTEPLSVGDFIDLDVLITPPNAVNQTIAFTASDGSSVDFLSGEFTASAPGEITVTATSFSDGSVSDQCVITIQDTLLGQSITQLVLVDAVSNLDISPLEGGDTLNFFYLPAIELNVRAETDPGTVGSVGFEYDGQIDFATENFTPYALTGDAKGDYNPWTPTLGSHTLTATPYTAPNRGGEAGNPKTVNFVVIDQDTTTTPPDTVGGPPTVVTGELKKWHKVTLSFEGIETSEAATDNPFANYRLLVTFSHGSRSYTVPGFYAADGQAENSSASSGNIWQAHFAPDAIGTWTYKASFRQGTDIAISTDPTAGSPTAFDGETGTFEIGPSDKSGRDFRSTGRLEYVGEHYLQFAETGDFFFKVGADAPENTFAYEDFDATPNKAGRRKSWAPHADDFDLDDAAEFTWGTLQSDGARADGRELLGALKYLSDQGMNVFSFLTFSLDGDDDNIYPHLQIVSNAISWSDVHHDRFDVSKLAQWEKILEYADTRGVYMHIKTQETENDQKMDAGQLGRERKLYYRELVARFGHHLALNWNLGEENDIWQELNDPNNDIVRSYTQYLNDIDPYDHNIVIHTYPGQQDEVYGPLLGASSELTGTSIQTGGNLNEVHSSVKKWVQESHANGKKWVVACDEPGSAQLGTGVDAAYPDSQLPEPRNNGDNRDAIRKQVLWGTMLAGGAGVEYYYGYQTGCDDLDCEDHRTRQTKWEDAKIALDFFNNHLQPYVTTMVSADELTADNDDYVLAQTGEIYLVYRPNGSATTLNLNGQSGTYSVQWYDPQNGGDLQSGSVVTVEGGSAASIGLPPYDTSRDWVALITNSSGGTFARQSSGEVSNIDDELSIDGIQFYPNPVKDVLVIQSNLEGELMVQIQDLNGKVLTTQVVRDADEIKLNMTSIQPGIYLLKVRHENTQRQFRIFKQ